MSSPSESQRKMDVLDMIITVLREHEVNLDRLCRRLDNLVEVMGTKGLEEEKEPQPRTKPFEGRLGSLNIEYLDSWDEFKEKCKAPDSLLFEINGSSFNVFSIINRSIIKYRENIFNSKSELPYYVENIQKSLTENGFLTTNLKCGLEVPLIMHSSITPEEQLSVEINIRIDVNKVKDWLSEQLKVDKTKIIAGKMNI